jgi:uncharacterized protein (DUF302 family)
MNFQVLNESVRDIVSKYGFGVLAEIKTSEVLKSKGYEYSPLTTYDVCNPLYAFKALSINEKFESLLPCHIVIKGLVDGCEVIAMLPEAMSAMVEDNSEIKLLMAEAEEKIIKIVDEIAKHKSE